MLQTEKSNLRIGCIDNVGAGDDLRQRNMEGERRTKRWRVMSPRVSNWLGCGREELRVREGKKVL